MMTPQERLEYFIKQRYKSKSAFARKMGSTPQLLNKYLNQDFVFSTYRKIEQLRKAGLNPEWYLKGTGDMDSEEVKQDLKAIKQQRIFNRINSLLNETQQLITELQWVL